MSLWREEDSRGDTTQWTFECDGEDCQTFVVVNSLIARAARWNADIVPVIKSTGWKLYRLPPDGLIYLLCPTCDEAEAEPTWVKDADWTGRR